MRRVWMLLIGILAINWADVSVAQEYTGPMPDWAEEGPLPVLPDERRDATTGGIAYLLSDQQVRKIPGGFQSYSRFAYEVTDRTGLETASRIEPTFDPEYASLDFHFIRIIRGGDLSDRLPDAEITILRQEQGLDNSLMDGRLTALINLQDVRVGDIIDYAYTRTRETPLWPDEYFDTISTEWSVPIAKRSYKLLVPAGYSIAEKRVETDIGMDISRQNGMDIYTLTVADPDPVAIENNLPDDLVNFGFVELSSMEGWSDIVDWALPLYAFSEPLSGEFAARVDEIAASRSSPEVRAVKALRLVQSEIRYLGIEAGLGSHAPRAPETTIAQGYGDCKDKTVLLVAVLRRLGIEAFPALASTSTGKQLADAVPSIGQFNHVIVGVSLNEETHWMDPTMSHQGGTLQGLAYLGYGYVLPLTPGNDALVRMAEPLPQRPTLEIAEAFTFPQEGDVGFRLQVINRYEGHHADWMRRRIAQTGQDNLAREFLDFYAKSYPGITPEADLEIMQDMDTNVIVLTENYTLDRETFDQNEFGTQLPVHAVAVQDVLTESVEANRTLPLKLPRGVSRRHIIRVHTPGKVFSAPESTLEEAAGVRFEREFIQDGEVLQMTFALRVEEDRVPLADVPKAIKIAANLVEKTDLSLNISVAAPTLSARLGLEETIDPDTEAELNAALVLISEASNVEALSKLNRLLANQAEPGRLRGYVQLLRGAVMIDLGRQKAAIAPLREAFATYTPTAADMYFQYVNILYGDEQYVDAAEMIIKLMEDHPDAIMSANLDWVAQFSGLLWREGEHEIRDRLSIAMAKAQLAHAEDMDEEEWIFAAAVDALARQGDAASAETYMPYVHAPESFVGLLIDRDAKAIWPVVEAHVGVGLSDVTALHVERLAREAGEAPDDLEKQHAYLSVLRFTGAFQEAVDFGKPIVENWAHIEAVGEDGYWFVNNYAYALSENGQAAEANALFRKLLALGLEENAGLVNMAINHAQFLLNRGEFDSVLKAVEAIEAAGQDVASEFGWMWIYDAKVCALHQSGDVIRANTVLVQDMHPISQSNLEAYMKTMLCLERQEDARDVMLRRLDDDVQRASAVAAFLRLKRSEHSPAFLEELISRARRVQADPYVRSKFEQYGRVIEVDGYETYWGSF